MKINCYGEERVSYIYVYPNDMRDNNVPAMQRDARVRGKKTSKYPVRHVRLVLCPISNLYLGLYV